MADTKPSEELQAMIAVEQALAPLEDDEVRGRVIRWAADRFGVSIKTSRQKPGSSFDDPEVDVDPNDYATLAEFHDAAGPSTDATRALVVGYWFQFIQGRDKMSSQSVNKELKDLGHPVGNITAAFTSLKDKRPAFSVQLAKSGKARQARKQYKITQAGKKEVERMLVSSGDAQD